VQEIYDRYDALTHTALAWQPQLLLWPEAATLSDLFDADTFAYLKQIAASTDAGFLLGSFQSLPDGGEYNIAACLTEHGKGVQIYRKMHLVPFGEYIPARNSFPLFAKIAGEMVPSDLRPGTEYTVFHLDAPALRLAPLICFEDTDGDHTRKFVNRDAGAQLLVNITNDSWFGRSPGAAQHLANALFRAIENRRPLVRAANTGVTCIIDAEGRVQHDLRNADGTPFLEGVLFGTVFVPRDAGIPFYARHGDWVAYVAAGVAAAAICFRLILGAAGRPQPQQRFEKKVAKVAKGGTREGNFEQKETKETKGEGA
jgi:apolipoprotein N-acyltransferase